MEQLLWTMIDGLPEPYGAIAMFALSVMGAASVLAAALPKGKEGGVWSKVRYVLDWVAANKRNAKNAE